MDGLNLLQTVVTGAFSAGVTWGLVRAELRWLRRDLDEVRRKVFNFEKSGSIKL